MLAAMPSYCAFLGHQPRISLAELSAVLPQMKLVRMVGNALAVIDTPADVGQRELSTWGGIMLLAQGIDTAPGKRFANIPQIVCDLTAEAKSKTVFSFRTDGVPRDIVHNLYRDTKQLLKKKGKGARYVGSESAPAATILLHELELLTGKHGCELVLLQDDEWQWVGRTVAAHDPNAYTKRDIGKPARDTRVGLLPPKLAQIMLNFGQWLALGHEVKRKQTLTVLDPFCGSGVIPMEALLRGWEVLASDASLKSVNACERNVEWLRKEEKILKKDVASEIWKQDAVKPFELKTKPDVIVTETMLGEPLLKRPSQKDITSLRSAVEKIEAGFIENASKTLAGVPMVCTFPVWMSATGPVFLEKIWGTIRDCGYETVLPPGVSTDVAVHKSLLYRRPDQFVGRQITLLRPKA